MGSNPTRVTRLTSWFFVTPGTNTYGHHKNAGDQPIDFLINRLRGLDSLPSDS